MCLEALLASSQKTFELFAEMCHEALLASSQKTIWQYTCAYIYKVFGNRIYITTETHYLWLYWSFYNPKSNGNRGKSTMVSAT